MTEPISIKSRLIAKTITPTRRLRYLPTVTITLIALLILINKILICKCLTRLTHKLLINKIRQLIGAHKLLICILLHRKPLGVFKSTSYTLFANSIRQLLLIRKLPFHRPSSCSTGCNITMRF